ncbi:MAG: 16S rRNA (cytidine(1402)-2'-O)-methyltransferase [Xanthomonadales bacterium]|nr:16S rRNA (cytidine(1402)-2'-O)-methyltransferase [Gammaproteobacteria bacterium]MBT8055379.1 16S rRNA (cytidine(1402)-2'-O)-methyltransferase [Gammaproteobacteria bacterium]NNL04720.1 16S rRNA (cytidine(1402)-2'-O)-methyltransferase [Xanthomonadales bacterium]
MSAAPLYIVATPIGNLQDITLRALELLASVDIVAAEDTRRSRVLLGHHGIERALLALHEHNEESQSPLLVERMKGGESVALVSDAGTPLLSDPGYRLVSLAVKAGIEVIAVPGASALTAALSVSGLPTDRFGFEGFLPAKRAARGKRLQSLADETRTLVFYESSHRIERCLSDMSLAFGADRPAAVCRELTKQFETVLRGPLADLHLAVASDPNQRRGEFVIVVGGAKASADANLARAVELARALLDDVGASRAARIAATIHAAPRREIYRQLLGPD